MTQPGETPTRPEEMITDWYLPENDPLDGFVYPRALPIRQYDALYEMAKVLLGRARDKTADGYNEFVIEAGTTTFRGHVIETVEGRVYALRRTPTTIPGLKALGIPEPIRAVMLDPWLNRGGLILVCGETGQGKSTTCAAMIKERMLKHGSFCLTVEDPPEMPLHGAHQSGRCIQTEVRQGGFAEAMRGAMRCYPAVSGSMLYVGETRDPETAAEVLTIATNGHLVLTTVHASDPISAISRFMALASAETPQEICQQNLASILRLVLHQTLKEKPSVGNAAIRRKLHMDFLMSKDRTTPVAAKIKQGRPEGLSSDITQQKMVLERKGMAGLKEMWSA